MMANEAFFSVAGYVATEPRAAFTRSGIPTVSMRLAWTPRRFDKETGEWSDEPSSFASVRCFRKLALHAQMSLRKGDPVIVTGTMRVRDYDASDGTKRTNVDVIATAIGPDLSRKAVCFTTVRPLEQPMQGQPPAEPGAEPAAEVLEPGEETGEDLAEDELVEDGELDEALETPAEPIGATF